MIAKIFRRGTSACDNGDENKLKYQNLGGFSND